MAAIDELRSILDYYGLSGLTDTLSERIIDDPTLTDNATVLLATVRDTPEYKTRFKGNDARRARGLPELAPLDYVRLEESYRETLRANSLPRGFYDTEADFANFIGSNVSPAELNTRISQGYNAVLNAEPGTKEELKRLYGLQDADLAAFFLDPERFTQSEAVKKAQAAQAAFEARTQAGFELTTAESEALARQFGTQTAEAARQGFTQIGATQELLGTTLQGEEALTREEVIAGTFGTRREAAQRIASRRRQRQAAFEAGGGFAGQGQATTALGTAGTQ